MRGRYASYWNAILFSIVSIPVPCSVYEPLLMKRDSTSQLYETKELHEPIHVSQENLYGATTHSGGRPPN